MRAWMFAAPLCLVGCATSPAQPVAPPRLQMPSAASEPCSLRRLPDQPTVADLEITLAARGAALVDCDGRRRLAVETAQAEHVMQEEWLARAPPSRSVFGWLSRGKSAAAAGSRP